ncbi:MAG: metal ABC transporter substrate-binding protein [Pseudomonadota bacterium]|nr:metal ABC transporter substrate-binding protein [Pseudomonadota bacterium]
MRLHFRFLLAALLFTLSPAAHAAPLKVVASFSILGDMTREIAGKDIALTTLVGPDSDAHVYEPSPADAKAIAGARLVIINGLGFEGWMVRLISSSGYGGPVIVASKGIATLETSGSQPDPHAWQDLANGKIYAANIRDALVQADPAHAAEYRSRAAQYIRRIDALDAWARQQIANIPAPQRLIISSHDAFQYFARAYGITFIAPLGIDTESDVSAAAMGDLVDQIRSRHIRAIFLENITDPRLIRQLQSDTRVAIGGTLYSDALSDDAGPAPTYLAMFRHNVTALMKAMAQP